MSQEFGTSASEQVNWRVLVLLQIPPLVHNPPPSNNIHLDEQYIWGFQDFHVLANPLRVLQHEPERALQMDMPGLCALHAHLNCLCDLRTDSANSRDSILHTDRLLHPHLWLRHASQISKSNQAVKEVFRLDHNQQQQQSQGNRCNWSHNQ